MSYMLNPTIILLKDGTDTSQGKGQIISNINACQAIADIVKTTLGPRGMDKLFLDNGKILVTNDGATVMKNLDIVHPAAQALVDIAMAQDSEVGDGTTTVVVLAGELLSQAKKLIEDGIHSQVIIKGFRMAEKKAKETINAMKISFEKKDLISYLRNCAKTSMQSKLIAMQREHFTDIVVQSVMQLDDTLDIDMIGIKKEQGGSLEDSFTLEGVAFKKCFSYAGFEQQPKLFVNPKIICLNIELELKKEKDNAEVRIDDPTQYQKIVDAEWQILYTKLENIVKSGANIVLSKLPIGDLATQYFADRKIFCAGRVEEPDLKRVCLATGAKIQTTVSELDDTVLGTCGKFEEQQIGKERYNLFSGCTKAKSSTIILRGGGEHFIDEAERSLHDAIMIVRRAMKHKEMVCGGGAVEMEIAKELKEYAMTIEGKLQYVVLGYAKAFEGIPRQLADNAGFDPTNILNLLRKKHSEGGKWFGVDVNNENILDMMETQVWEPALIKLNAVAAATEAAGLIISIDETIKAPEHKN
ncbi:T-complex protein 1 subunit eta, putative [Entamoeba invadens IP1]|uniref:T-complex protein 1 subunit eta n=2 Tax=Entamoeba invadens TaxID=33085 RepID=L7FNH8_ENTIV|nr:T-complex protein 1 subunit eta, putative [Entamoeba invadens IP1]ELP92229.1 T-complex protein 1 subunit eta, putative [Entamoeba invadens IP1]BAN40310.1 T-complex protein 1 subunit eta, putative [Entamoeba invadens]BAN40374.1 T-complex protein 1 subunit eta, putative [Entamoeba invadens]BAN40539.1 T-complex protein 1 subunit eta, putative [Entamoeba invadens]|eukprot:XP_004259000.1 T-complex protein 1 subunit eta, putative [Entamoeba invadens IP1]